MDIEEKLKWYYTVSSTRKLRLASKYGLTFYLTVLKIVLKHINYVS